MYRFRTLLIAGLVFIQLGLSSQTVQAADEVKVVIYNGSSSVINRIILYVDTVIVDTEKKNFPAGQTNHVNWEVGNKKNEGDLTFEYAMVASPKYEKCTQRIQTKGGSPAGQLRSVILADGRVYNLDNTVDEVVTVRFKVTGTKEKSNCSFDGVRQRNR